jgi:hypothetical protein
MADEKGKRKTAADYAHSLTRDSEDALLAELRQLVSETGHPVAQAELRQAARKCHSLAAAKAYLGLPASQAPTSSTMAVSDACEAGTRLLPVGKGGSELLKHRDVEAQPDEDDCCESGCACCSGRCWCALFLLLVIFGGGALYVYLAFLRPHPVPMPLTCANHVSDKAHMPRCTVDECNTTRARLFERCGACYYDSECAGFRTCVKSYNTRPVPGGRLSGSLRSRYARIGLCGGLSCCV